MGNVIFLIPASSNPRQAFGEITVRAAKKSTPVSF